MTEGLLPPGEVMVWDSRVVNTTVRMPWISWSTGCEERASRMSRELLLPSCCWFLVRRLQKLTAAAIQGRRMTRIVVALGIGRDRLLAVTWTYLCVSTTTYQP